MALSNDQLLSLMDASPLLDQVETGLRKVGQKDLADKLMKLQQDAGVAWECESSNYDPIAGNQTAKLDSGCEEVTPARHNAILQASHAALPEGDLKNTLGMLNKKLLIPETRSAAPAKQKQKIKI